MLLEPTAWAKIKGTRGDKTFTFQQVLEAWVKKSVKDSQKCHYLTRSVSASFICWDAFHGCLQLAQMLLGERHVGLAHLSKYLRENKFVSDLTDFHTKHDGPGGMDIPDRARWSDEALDVLELNNLMAKVRQLQAKEGDVLVLEQRMFREYLEKSRDKKRAQAIVAMMKVSYVAWGQFTPGEFAKVGSKQTKELFEAYERACHVWKGIEQIPEVKRLWMQIRDRMERKEAEVWVEQAEWELRSEEAITLAEDETLAYLAPLQQNMAAEAKDQERKNMVDKMNRIMMDTLAIAGVSQEDEMKVPEEVMGPLKQLVQVSKW